MANVLWIALGAMALAISTACAAATPTPTSTPTATPTLSQLVKIQELTCTDLYPGVQPPPGSPTHTLTASGTIANLNPAPITVVPLLQVVASDGTVAAETRGESFVVLGSRPAEPFSVSYHDSFASQNSTCRVALLAGQETVAEATAPIAIVYAP